MHFQQFLKHISKLVGANPFLPTCTRMYICKQKSRRSTFFETWACFSEKLHHSLPNWVVFMQILSSTSEAPLHFALNWIHNHGKTKNGCNSCNIEPQWETVTLNRALWKPAQQPFNFCLSILNVDHVWAVWASTPHTIDREIKNNSHLKFSGYKYFIARQFRIVACIRI